MLSTFDIFDSISTIVFLSLQAGMEQQQYIPGCSSVTSPLLYEEEGFFSTTPATDINHKVRARTSSQGKTVTFTTYRLVVYYLL